MKDKTAAEEPQEPRPFYDIMGLPRDATQAQVRTAYKKMALKLHPDRNPDPTAGQKFDELKKAYEVLGNPDTRSIYDALGEEGLKEAMAGSRFDPFGRGGFRGQRGPSGPPKGRPMRMGMRLTLAEFYNGVTKTVSFRRRVVDADGNQMIEEKEIEVHVDKGVKLGKQIIFSEEGDQMPGIVPGDVIVVLQQLKDKEWTREGPILIREKTITLREALCGVSFSFKHLDGRIIKVSHSGEVISPNTLKVIPNEGMPFFRQPFEKGHMIIKFQVKFPAVLEKEAIEHVEKWLPGPSAEEVKAEFDALVLESEKENKKEKEGEGEEEEEEATLGDDLESGKDAEKTKATSAEKEADSTGKEEKDAGGEDKEEEEEEGVEVVEVGFIDFDPGEIQRQQKQQKAATDEDESRAGGGPQVVQCASQ